MNERQTSFNPFPGLRPFESTENHLFFGRDGQSDALLRRLRRTRFLAVVGTSGSGKSSLMRAGLLPALHGGLMAKAGSRWRIALLRPGADPLGNLAAALNEVSLFNDEASLTGYQTSILRATLSRSTLGLVETARQARMPKNENLLVVVDQFEELFRFKQGTQKKELRDEAFHFVQLLLEAFAQKQVNIYIVLTMRSDFIGDCAQFLNLPEAINDGQYLIPRMTREQRRQAITGPVAVARGQISPRLVNRLLNDVGDNPDQLPILQHALMRTWNYWQEQRQNSEPLDLQHYENIGGMTEALSHHADEAYKELHDEHSQRIAAKLFKCLTEKGTDNREIRRPTKLQEICATVEADEKEVIAIIERFRQTGRSFLMPPAGDDLTQNSLIDISHESLIRNWQRLKTWVEEESQSAQMYRRLAESAVLYQEGKAALWRDPDLQIALKWRERNQPNEDWARRYHSRFNDAITFIEKSYETRNAELEAQEVARQRELQQAKALADEQKQRAEEQTKSAKRLRFAVALLFVGLIAMGAAWIAVKQALLAKEAQERAEVLRNEAQHSQIRAEDFATVAQKERNKALQAQLQAEQSAQAAEDSASVAQMARGEALLAQQAAENFANAAQKARGEALAARDKARTSQQQAIAVALTIKSQHQRKVGNHALSALLATESYRFDSLSSGLYRSEVYEALRTSLNALNGKGGPTILPGHRASVSGIAVSPDGQTWASCGADSTVRLWQLHSDSGWQIIGRHQASVTAIAFSPDGKRLASGSTDRSIILWPLQNSNTAPTVLSGHSARVWSLAFNPAGNLLASVGADSTVRLWDWQNERTGQILGKHNGSVRAVAFSPNGKTLASGSVDGRILLWNLNNRKNIPSPDTLKFQTKVRAIVFNPNGEFLAVACENGTVQLVWPRQNRRRTLRGHQKRVNAVAFDPAGKRLASASSDKTVRIWYLNRPEIEPLTLSEHKSSVWSVAFAQQGDLLISGSADKNIYLWNINAGELNAKIHALVKRTLTRDEWEEFIGTEIEYPYGER